jgi:FMN-dependent NADH-azoreductase
MPKLLYVSVSPQGDNSRSRDLGREFLSTFKESHTNSEVIERDLNSHPVPHLDGETIFAGYLPEDKRSSVVTEKHNLRVSLADEAIGADEIVVSTPMWNWSTPSVLKAYLDQMILPDVLSKKQLAGKRVTVLIACGGAYGPGSWHPEYDYETGYLKHIFTAIGATDVEVIRTEFCMAGVAPGMENLVDKKEESFKEAKAATTARARATASV